MFPNAGRLPEIQYLPDIEHNAISSPDRFPNLFKDHVSKKKPATFECNATALRIGLRPGGAPAAYDIRRLKLSALVVGFFDPLLQRVAQSFLHRPVRG